MFEALTEKLTGIFGRLRRKGRLTEADVDEALREVRIALLEADVNLQVAREFVRLVREQAVGQEVWQSLTPDQMIIKIVHEEAVRLLGDEPPKLNWSPSPPTVVLMCGLQGSGKTTTAAKLAAWLQKQGKKTMLAACDLQRPAAIHQLQVLGEQIGAPVHAELDSKDPVKVAKDALAQAKHHFSDVLIIDTAGRLQIDEELMEQIRRIRSALDPTEVLFVADATTGQEAVNVAKAFDEALGITGLVFTKLDGDTRGGAVLSVKAVTGRPIRFVGIGEKIDALEPFHGDRMAQRILGFGDVMSLIEKATEAVEPDEARSLAEKLKSGAFTFEDMLHQFKLVRRMGSLKSVLKLIPGIGRLPKELLDQVGDASINRVEAMILSMTPLERRNPDILSASRKRRVAAGSGTSVQEVNRLIRQLGEMRKQMKSFTRLAASGRLKRASRRR
ncbi:MAG: signal recognition particle protein [Armatimonadetes bacterium]|nr:signal recognition particle protein [Armatimonadota bacterium]NOG91965.1 signal recognition particle protein [Armatimonadota bacterium]